MIKEILIIGRTDALNLGLLFDHCRLLLKFFENFPDKSEFRFDQIVVLTEPCLKTFCAVIRTSGIVLINKKAGLEVPESIQYEDSIFLAAMINEASMHGPCYRNDTAVAKRLCLDRQQASAFMLD